MASTPIFRGIVESGKIKWHGVDRKRLDVLMKHLDRKEVEMTLRAAPKKRTLSQNAYLHVLIHILADHCGYDDDEMKDAVKWKYLKIHDDTDLPTVKSTAKLDTKEMGEFIDNLKRFGADLGVYLPDPGECLQ